MGVPDDIAFLQWLLDQGFKHPKPIGNGQYAGILPKLFTHAVVVGRIGDYIGFDDLWCYTTEVAATTALNAWDGRGEPTGWVRHPASGRRVSQSPDEFGEDGPIGATGVTYIRR
jgi:hypothetical protein